MNLKSDTKVMDVFYYIIYILLYFSLLCGLVTG